MCSEKEKIYLLARIIQSNKDFDVIHFFDYIDFVEFNESYYDNVIYLTNHYFDDSDIYKTIKEYMDDKYIKEIAPLNFETLYDDPDIYINNIQITNDIINKVIEFMRIKDYPMINYIYCVLLERYLDKGSFE